MKSKFKEDEEFTQKPYSYWSSYSFKFIKQGRWKEILSLSL